MTDTSLLPRFVGTGAQRLGFSDIDQRFELKTRAFIEIAMPPIFAALEREFSLFRLRERGIAPIMFFLDFQALPLQVAFGHPVESEHEIAIRRQEGDNPDGSRSTRLILDMRSDIFAFAGHSGNGDIGFGPGKGPRQPAGYARVLQVLTRPTAARGERNLREVPAELARLQVHPWNEVFPTVELLSAAPADLPERPDLPCPEFRSVWGMPNTDINQHVNVQEYIRAGEDHFTRQLHGAALPVALHRINRARHLFRKPFFAGQPYAIRSRLFERDGQTVCIARFHSLTTDGTVEPEPHIVLRLEGNIRA